ncbi:putative transcription factor & chromatin remodeling ARID family [Helianthus anomalus]
MILKGCLAFKELVEMHEELIGHELLYDVTFEELLKWFVSCYLGICKEGEIPPTLLNGKDVNLITIYRVITKQGGLKKVDEDDAWEQVAVQCRFFVVMLKMSKVSYVRYVDLLEWYFQVMKNKRMEKTNLGSNKLCTYIHLQCDLLPTKLLEVLNSVMFISLCFIIRI